MIAAWLAQLPIGIALLVVFVGCALGIFAAGYFAVWTCVYGQVHWDRCRRWWRRRRRGKLPAGERYRGKRR